MYKLRFDNFLLNEDDDDDDELKNNARKKCNLEASNSCYFALLQ